jgi:mRNA-degrading endonuclease toxin of MazEF toxin-antitoxin module
MSTKIHKASQHRILLPVAEIIQDVGYPDPFQDSVALTDQIRVLDVTRLEVKMGRLSDSAVISVGLGLSFLFNIL